MSTDTEIQADTPPVETDDAPKNFRDLPAKEQHAIFARVTAFKAAFLDYEKELKAQYGDTLFKLYEETGSKSFAHHLDDKGSSVQFTVKETQDNTFVADQAEYLDWVQEHYPSETDVQVIVQPAFTTVLLKRLERVENEPENEGDEPTVTFIDPDTGLEVPGIGFKKGGITRDNGFAPSWKKDGKQLAINSLMGSSVDAVLPVLTAGDDK